MKKTVLIFGIVALVGAGALFYVLRKPTAENQLTPAQIKALPQKQVFDLAVECDEKKISEHCTLIMEVNALKAQHAKEGEKFWINQMLRLGSWYTYVGTKDWSPGKSEAPEIAKAKELYDWLLENKPFFGDRALLGYAKLYDSPHNAEWARANAKEAAALYDRLQRKFPDSPYASEVTAALARIQ
jgi:hypothetical protein